VREAESWWLVSELVRRHPELTIIQTHPGGGQYDCLEVGRTVEGAWRKVMDVNRHGSIHIMIEQASTQGGGEEDDLDDDDWMITDWVQRALASDDPHALLKDVEQRAGLAVHGSTPASSRRTLAFRVIASAARGAMTSKEWSPIRNWYFDSSGGGGDEQGAAGPDRAGPRARVSLPDDVMGTPAYRFWMLLGETGETIVETDGRAWLPSGREIDLFQLYREGWGVQRLAAEVLAT